MFCSFCRFLDFDLRADVIQKSGMKTLLILFVLFFSSSAVAEDISDFEIEGMSIGDSLLDYFSEEEITSAKKTIYPKSKKYFDVWFTSKTKLYEELSIALKENDNKYIIHGVSGVKKFKNNFDQCKKFKKDVIKDLVHLFPNIKQKDYEYVYKDIEDGKSIAYITDFNLNNGAVRIYCQDWSSITENERGWIDEGRVDISTKLLIDWLTIAN